MSNVNTDIKTGQLKQVYLLYGEETYLRRQHTQNLIKAFGVDENDMNFNVFKGEGLDAQGVVNTINTIPFLSDKRVTVIYDSGFCNSSNDLIADCIEHIPESSYVIFNESKVKKNTKVFKSIHKLDGDMECTMPTEHDLQIWIAYLLKAENKSITKDGWQAFAEATYSNKELRSMEYMYNEVQKIISYCIDKDTITREDIEAICSPTYQDHIFDMINAIGDKDSSTVLRLYEELLVSKVPPMKIMSNIVRQFKHLLALGELLDNGSSPNQAAKELGLYPFIVQKYLKMNMFQKFPPNAVKAVLNDAADTTWRIRNGQIDEKIGVELLMVKYSK
ncbi:MAG: DNA polymerase III subunit delta [Lachnospiraceae bacterium]|nr:DNA polymerase III subunit delta [Lachnospiraceae bacterium]